MAKGNTARLLIALVVLAGAAIPTVTGTAASSETALADYVYLHVSRRDVSSRAVSCPG